jgi:CRISPR system Cascade subunit CasC
VTALAEYWKRINTAYGLNETARAFSVQSDVKLNDKAAPTLADLEAWVIEDGQV